MSNAAAGPSRKRKTVPAPKPKKDPAVALALLKAKDAAANITDEEIRDDEHAAGRHLRRLVKSVEEKHSKLLETLAFFLNRREPGLADRVLKEGGELLSLRSWCLVWITP